MCASEANAWAMDLPRQAFPHLIAPQVTQQVEGDRSRLCGQGVPPPVLLLAGNYQVPAGGEDPIWLGLYQGAGDRIRVQFLLALHERLVQWAKPEASPVLAAYIPFGERIHFLDSWMMVPAAPRNFDFLLRHDHARLGLAIRVTEDWLHDHIVWAPAPVVPSGLRVWHVIRCDLPVGDQLQSCHVALDAYWRNPQVPHGWALDVEYYLFP